MAYKASITPAVLSPSLAVQGFRQPWTLLSAPFIRLALEPFLILPSSWKRAALMVTYEVNKVKFSTAGNYQSHAQQGTLLLLPGAEVSPFGLFDAFWVWALLSFTMFVFLGSLASH